MSTLQPWFSRHDAAYDLITERLVLIREAHTTHWVDEFGETVWAYEIDNGSTRFEWELLTVDEGRH